MLFYTHVTDRFTPFHTKVIAANAGEAAHVLDGLLDHESELVIREHATDTAGAVDHVFGLCHLLGFRFAPRIRDLNERRLYGLSSLDPWPTLRLLVAGPVNVRAIEADWDETLRLAASIRAGTVSASVMLRKLAGGHNGKEGARICPDAKSLRYRTSCWINCWLAATLAPRWRRVACWMR